jgi:hypothetical protein
MPSGDPVLVSPLGGARIATDQAARGVRAPVLRRRAMTAANPPKPSNGIGQVEDSGVATMKSRPCGEARLPNRVVPTQR